MAVEPRCTRLLALNVEADAKCPSDLLATNLFCAVTVLVVDVMAEEGEIGVGIDKCTKPLVMIVEVDAKFLFDQVVGNLFCVASALNSRMVGAAGAAGAVGKILV